MVCDTFIGLTSKETRSTNGIRQFVTHVTTYNMRIVFALVPLDIPNSHWSDAEPGTDRDYAHGGPMSQLKYNELREFLIS